MILPPFPANPVLDLSYRRRRCCCCCCCCCSVWELPVRRQPAYHQPVALPQDQEHVWARHVRVAAGILSGCTQTERKQPSPSTTPTPTIEPTALQLVQTTFALQGGERVVAYLDPRRHCGEMQRKRSQHCAYRCGQELQRGKQLGKGGTVLSRCHG